MKKSKLEKYVRAADLGDNAASNFVNYGVKKKPEGKYRLTRMLVIFAYAAIAFAYVTFALSIRLPMMITFAPVLTWMLVFFTWRFVSIEYEYYILDGEFRMLEIYGSRNMRELCRVRVSAMKTLAPYRDEYKSAADAVQAQNRIEGVSSMSAADVYYGIYNDSNGNECVVFFEAAEKTLKVLRYYNPEIVTAKTVH